MVEMALVLLVLSTFLFGIISFGYLFSFRQNMTQAAAEGARAAAVAVTNDPSADATKAVADAVQTSFGKSCGTKGLSCTISPVQACSNDSTKLCVTVTLKYDYKHYPLLPDAPVIAGFMPKDFSVASTARVS